MFQKEQLEDLRFTILFKASTLDRSNQTEINEFNSIVKHYKEIINPELKEERKAFADKFKSMKHIFEADSIKAEVKEDN